MLEPARQTRRATPPEYETVLCQLAENARQEDAGTADITRSVTLLRQSGLIDAPDRQDPCDLARLLMRVGGANLSLGRLLEGHVNALQLIRVFGSGETYRMACAKVAEGGFWGVWGADDSSPVAIDPQSNTLTGRKKFASGLGVLSHALVPVGTGPEARMALIEVSDPARADTSAWDMPGMKATVSGTYDFTGLPVGSVDWLGKPGDYIAEPHFVGGIWRIAALQIGGATGLLTTAAEQLRKMGRIDAEPQKIRLGQLAMKTLSATALVLKAAGATGSNEHRVALAIAARLQTEEIALEVIAGIQQSIGLAHFAPQSDTERKARDLSVYLRQAARDALLSRFAETTLRSDGDTWGVML